jgi:hypothetical protein
MHWFDSHKAMVEKFKVMSPNFFGFTFCSEVNWETQLPRFKVVSKKFARAQELMGRTSNLYLRYMEAKAEGNERELIETFPSIRKFSSWVEKSVFETAKKATNLYVEKYVKKNHATPVDFYLRPIIAAAHQNYQEKRVRVTVDTVVKQLFAEHPKRLNFILNGLGFINTGDVRLPVADAPAPVVAAAPALVPAIPLSTGTNQAQDEVKVDAFPPLPSRTDAKLIEVEPPTEEEIFEMNMGIDVAEQQLPAHQYVMGLDSYEYSRFLRDNFMPIIFGELEMAWDAGVPITRDLAEEVFYRLAEMDFEDIMMCVEDQSMLVENVRELIRAEPIRFAPEY